VSDNIHQCHRCPRADFSARVARCTLSGSDIADHAAAGYCPHPGGPRFGDGAIPAGWTPGGLWDVVALGINAVSRAVTGKPKKPCGGCKGRQAKLNKLVPFRREPAD
jgi:hypothetical protein